MFMPKTAFLFPGQGSQKPGMGRELAENFTAAKQIFDEADAALGFAISQLCFEGPEEDLKLTENTQPAILTCSVATLAVLRDKGLQPDYVAGHSLGEYSALVAAGALSFTDAACLVRRRGRYMQEAVPEGVGAMAAILGLADNKLEEVCREAAAGEVVSAANRNSPGQVVIAGHRGAVERAVVLAKQAGARKAILLQVSAPFHCSLMQPAADRLAADLDAAAILDLKVPLVNNAWAREVTTAEDARAGLKQQVANPVRWEESMRLLAAHGVERFVEVGSGKVLTGLLRNIDRTLNGAHVEDLATLEKLFV
jgi:[acyl-carrier-protein] S-malonyltransferase